MSRSYNITLDDERAQMVERVAKENGIPASTYLRSLLEQSIHTTATKPNPTDYKVIVDQLYNAIMSDTSLNGKEFVLRDLPLYQQLCIVSAKNGQISIETVRASIGKIFNRKIAHGFYKGIVRATSEHGALKFKTGAAVYRKEI